MWQTETAWIVFGAFLDDAAIIRLRAPVAALRAVHLAEDMRATEFQHASIPVAAPVYHVISHGADRGVTSQGVTS